MSKVGEVVKSPEFAELAENLNNIVEDVSGHRVDIQRGVMPKPCLLKSSGRVFAL